MQRTMLHKVGLKRLLAIGCALCAFAAPAEQTIVRISDATGRTGERMASLKFTNGRATFRLDWGSVGASTRQITVKTDFMVTRDGETGYWILPTGELGVFEKGKTGSRNCARDCRAPMAFYGMKTQHGTWVAIVKGMALNMDVEVVAKDGAYEIHPVFKDFKTLYEDVEIEFIRQVGAAVEGRCERL